ncbi:MAG: ABC transporter permease [Clostridia bacterium]|nr:ABC transporter permease [Clostridia bacterium]
MKLLNITFYKLKMMLSDRLFFAAMIIIPIFIMFSAGYAIKQEKLDIIPVAAVDEDKSSYSGLFLKRFGAKEGLKIEHTDRAKAAEMLRKSRVEAVVVIKEGFEEKLISGDKSEVIDLIKQPSTLATGYIGEVAAGEVMRLEANNLAADWVVRQYEKLNKPVSEGLYDEVIRYTDAQWEPVPLMTVDYMEMQGDKPVEVHRVTLPAATASSMGILAVFILIFVLFNCGWLIEEKRNGTLKRLVSGYGALGYSFLGNILALLIAGAAQIILFALVSGIFFKIDLFPDKRSYILLMVYLLAAISIGLFLSAVLKTTTQMQAFAPVFALLTGFIGGCFWNFIDVSERLKQLALLTPQGWVLKGLGSLAANTGDIGMPFVVLTGISAVLLPMSYLLISRSVRA